MNFKRNIEKLEKSAVLWWTNASKKIPQKKDLLSILVDKHDEFISILKRDYKNYKEEVSERIIKPIKFEMIERKTNFYDRLCVQAYCNLREDNRIFAIYRIQKLKIIE